ncbi:M28 family metallopeptidase [Stakelama tenebrarum]|uniref:M28 family peptidase n=1 Tax=Stakelama tenebrarum TaxID=2711215 RepID=A0A6G6Y9R9_9SPHN|nr:M28 family metallopeptidase [Sphingosinithalassobacter tenebrarum]QIG81650.1 M28 family peptidase [Sphingosinithalassobacter tenebrarum]
MLRFPLALALAALAFPAAAQVAPDQTGTPAKNEIITAPLPEDQAAMKAHVMFLATDAMQGREAGSPEYDIAAHYVASQYYAAGLRPAGDNGGYLQRVPLTTYKLADRGAFTLTGPDGEESALVFGEDYVPGANAASATTDISGELVFVGFGIDAPGEGHDDYAGVDVTGKIVVFLNGVPDDLHSEIRATLRRASSKAEMAARRGAIGAILIDNPTGGRSYPFSALAANWQRAGTTWVDAQGNGHSPSAAAPLLATISADSAAKLFEGAETGWEDIAAKADDTSTAFEAFPLETSLHAVIHTEREDFVSYNVAGILPGSDPDLASEVVVLTAHLDHVGVGNPDASGDTIYNGAEDNAVGIASLIEEAKRFQESGEPPRRSVLFLAVTAEEKGLVGSDYFANNPTLPGHTLVADVNLDMPILTYAFEDIIAFGADRSTLGPIVRKAAQDAGVGYSPDPMPEQSLFVRSDHYRFVQQGIPSVFVWPGFAGNGEAGTNAFFADHYHKPSDEVGQSPAIDWEAGVRFINVNYQIAREIADADETPVWNEGDYFGTLYEGPMAD